MQNLAEQKRVFDGVVGVLVCCLVAVILMFALFFAGLFPDASVFGLRLANYVGEDENGEMEKGDLMVCKDFNIVDSPLTNGEYGAFYIYTRDSLNDITGRELMVKMIDNSYKTVDNEKIAIFYHELDGNGDQCYAEIPAQNVVGTVLFGIPFLGFAGSALTATFYSGVIFLIVFCIVLIVPSIIVLIKKVEVYRRISPFPEGVNTEKFNGEQLFIYKRIRSFLKKSAHMQIKKGFDCDKVYKDRKPFCKIKYMDKAIYVLINGDFARYDGRVDRSGYIRIEHAYQLESAKDRINELYHTHFKKQPAPAPTKEISYNGLPNVKA